MARQKIPGLAVGIYNRGQILLAKGYGQSNVELNVPVKPETIFQSGSVGKQFVSAAIMMLVEEGKLSIDDSVTKYFPGAPSWWKPILIKNLLSHTSGLAEYESGDRIGPKGPFYLRLDFTEDELVTKIEALPKESAPGEKWNYRNTNYVLLGILIHKLTGKVYYEYLDERIFKPLGMTSTRIISDRDIIPNRSAGYEMDNGQLKNQDWVSPTFNATADGTLYFNVLDLVKWDNALYGTQLLKQSSLDRIWTVYPLNDGKPNPASYGFAWMIDKQNGHKRIHHSGAWQGFTCSIERYPDDNLAVVVLTNIAGADPSAIAQVTAGLANSALLPPKLAAIADNQPAIAGALAKTLDQLAAGQDIRSQTTPELAAEISPDMIKYVQRRLSGLWPSGTLTLVKRTPSADPNGQPTSLFRLSKGSEAVLVRFGLAANGKISTMGITPDREYDL
jgi:CubicO group peptidase (beta-lactamase class C family)